MYSCPSTGGAEGAAIVITGADVGGGGFEPPVLIAGVDAKGFKLVLFTVKAGMRPPPLLSLSPKSYHRGRTWLRLRQ